MRIGDIFVSKKCEDTGDLKIFIVTDVNKKYATIKFEKDGKLRYGGTLPTKVLAYDTDRYEKVSHLSYERMIIDKLRAERRKRYDR